MSCKLWNGCQICVHLTFFMGILCSVGEWERPTTSTTLAFSFYITLQWDRPTNNTTEARRETRGSDVHRLITSCSYAENYVLLHYITFNRCCEIKSLSQFKDLKLLTTAFVHDGRQKYFVLKQKIEFSVKIPKLLNKVTLCFFNAKIQE